MTNISPSAEAAREAARASDGRFAPQAHSEPEAVIPAPTDDRDEFTQAEEAHLAALDKRVFDDDLAGAAVRAAGLRLYPGAESLVFEMNYTDEGACLEFDSVIGPADAAEDSDRERIDGLVFPMSGAGCTGEEITGMRHVDGDTFIFEL